MITAADKELLKAELGNNYAPATIRILNKKGVLNTKGKPFRGNSITQVMNGNIENLDIELAIYEARDEVRAKKEALKKARAAGAKSA